MGEVSARIRHEHLGLSYETHTEVYVPHDDTWLLVEAVQGQARLDCKTVLEVGCGAGLGVIAALRRGAARGIATDRNLSALRLARRNADLNGVGERFRAVHTDLFEAIRSEDVDLVLFNPPYLPTAPEEKLPGDLNLAFDGGMTGNETILRFVDALQRHAAGPRIRSGRRGEGRGGEGRGGEGRGAGAVPSVLIVLSSLNDLKAIRDGFAAAGLVEMEELGAARFDFERLAAYLFQRA